MLVGDVRDGPSNALLPGMMLLTFMSLATLLAVKRSDPTDAINATGHNAIDALQDIGRDELDKNGRDRHGCLRQVRLNREDGFTHRINAHYYGGDRCRSLPLGVSDVKLSPSHLALFKVPCFIVPILGVKYYTAYHVDVSECCKEHSRALFCADTQKAIDSADANFVACLWDRLWTVATSNPLCHPVTSSALFPTWAGQFWAQFTFAFFAASFHAALRRERDLSPCLLNRGHHNRKSCLCGGTETTVSMVDGKWEVVCPTSCSKCRLECQYGEDNISAVGYRHINPDPWKKCCPGTDRHSLEKAAGDLKTNCPDKCSSTCKWVCEPWIIKAGRRWSLRPDPWKLDRGNPSLPCCGGDPPKPPPELCPVVDPPPVRDDNQRGVE